MARKTGKKATKSARARPATRPQRHVKTAPSKPRREASDARGSSKSKPPAEAVAKAPPPEVGRPIPKTPGKETSKAGSADGASGTSRSSPLGRGKKVRTVAEAASGVHADAKGYVFINGRRVRMISTKNAQPIKKPRSNGTPEPSQAVDATPIKSIKTKLSRKELNHYRELLLLKRRELVGDLHAMETEALRSGGGNLSHMPIHMADIGTDTYDQDFMLGLAAAERDQLREIDAALQRIEDRSYGVCQLTGKPIPKARLDAKPWAKYTIEAARKMEGQWGR